MLLDPETWDLVQHIDSVLAAVEHSEHRGPHSRGADAVGARGDDAGVQDRGRHHALALSAARLRRGDRARRGLPLRLGRHASVQPLRAAAHHREGPLPAARRPAAVHRAARADLRDAHARRDRRSGEGDPGRERAARPPAADARALRVVAVLAGRADRVSRRAGRWCSRRSRVRARRRASRTTPTTPRSSASSSAPAASPTTRTSGGTSARTRASARSRCASATRSRGSRTSSRSPRSSRRS